MTNFEAVVCLPSYYRDSLLAILVLGSKVDRNVFGEKDLVEVILGVKYHHERYDGTGYPQGLKGDEIPLIAAIIAVADSFDAMITDRPYRRAVTPQEAVLELKRGSGTQFHPRLVSAAITLCARGAFAREKNVALGTVFE